ncbi:hypothetical protein NLM16_27865 [Bradyrhizobium brasilense]|uniref:hypothetical protein n=1 Tax=Bradyrhizobium brasilense TaxID=1419277 RepID=UPI00287727D2|nr:hypothetical protein [Bradyrhizobium brasilense]MCP3417929.1 hypothetical protein [Bradyrhizobium brasilense]
MTEQDDFAVWLAGAVLRTDDRDVAALALQDIASQAGELELDAKLDEMRKFNRAGGDFGAEIIGPLLIPILVEAAKQLWAAYLKKIAEKTAGALADVTAKTVKDLIRAAWSSDNVVLTSELEAHIRAAATEQNLPQEELDRLIASLRNPKLGHELAATD